MGLKADRAVPAVCFAVLADHRVDAVAGIYLNAGLIGIAGHQNAGLFAIKRGKLSVAAAIEHKVVVDASG